MKEGKIQTLHPDSNKTNKIIDIAKYEIKRVDSDYFVEE